MGGKGEAHGGLNLRAKRRPSSRRRKVAEVPSLPGSGGEVIDKARPVSASRSTLVAPDRVRPANQGSSQEWSLGPGRFNANAARLNSRRTTNGPLIDNPRLLI